MKIAEVALKYKTQIPLEEMPKVECPDDAVTLLRSVWDEDTIQLREEFIVILLNNSKKCLGWSRVSIGGASCTIVDIASIFQIALLGNANSMILAHNHPSGALKPSTADIHLTNRVKKSGELLGITVDDHIILSQDGYYSFRKNRLV
ncbi:MAG: JAB domain-containing protein [Balneolaceae bacterium]|nr:JAB domain-containing protein [Balneolaceae bacterium]